MHIKLVYVKLPILVIKIIFAFTVLSTINTTTLSETYIC